MTVVGQIGKDMHQIRHIGAAGSRTPCAALRQLAWAPARLDERSLAAMAESGGINLGALSLEQLNQLRQSIEEVRGACPVAG